MPTITQAGVVTTALTNVPAPSYSYVAGWTTGFVVAAQHSIVIAPHTVGNLLIAVLDVNTTAAITGPGVSGTGTGSWADIGEGIVTNTTLTENQTIFTGKVTAVGATTLTYAWAGGGTLGNSMIQVAEFTCPGVDASTTWTIDSHGKTIAPAATSQIIPLPFLSPSAAASPMLYWATAFDVASINTGVYPGFSWSGNLADKAVNGFNTTIAGPVNPSIDLGAAGPANAWITSGFETYARIAKAQFDNLTITLQPVPTGRMWIISQIGFEFLPANTLQTMTCTIVLNNRVVKPGINPNAGGQFQGPPYITVRAGDTMTVNFTNVPVGTSAIANFLYNEYSAYATAHELGGVV